MMPRFFIDAPLTLPAGTVFAVPATVAQHIQVLRLRPGDTVTLFDGNGGETPAVLHEVGKRSASVTLGAHLAREAEPPYRITLIQGIAGGDKMDWLLEKAVELGIAACQPVQTERSVVRLQGDRAARREAHWLALARAACEQCGRNRVPEIHPILSWREWIASQSITPTTAPTLLLSPRGETRLSTWVDARQTEIRAHGVRLLIGPEGGLSPDEEERAIALGAIPLTLGPRVLRTETAGLAALAALHATLGEF
ncbi:16S rRNA (uracil(1498)-N(3))-methyltransferase [Imbroritus primus]|jgi:16S rRNA (uracil1498-N3)-methyltransferase|uniref:16S rRNA (uracil(1498)-N(3))-methyltransferase n=1 Tax=Imbroritus primus TaxID=3058603 RepID=UPI003D160DB3